jgi:hypothetical protein
VCGSTRKSASADSLQPLPESLERASPEASPCRDHRPKSNDRRRYLLRKLSLVYILYQVMYSTPMRPHSLREGSVPTFGRVPPHRGFRKQYEALRLGRFQTNSTVNPSPAAWDPPAHLCGKSFDWTLPRTRGSLGDETARRGSQSAFINRLAWRLSIPVSVRHRQAKQSSGARIQAGQLSAGSSEWSQLVERQDRQ